MTFAKRKTVAHELFTQLENLFASDDMPDVFTLTKLQRDANALEKVDAATASLVRGGIAALNWDFSETERWVQNSIRLDGSVDNWLNVGLTYKQVNRLDLTAECALRGYAMAPKNQNVVASVLESLCICGRFTEAEGIYQQAIADDVALDSEIMVPSMHLRHMAELGIEPDRVTFEIMAAHHVLAIGRKRSRAIEVGIFTDHDGSDSMLIQLGFFGTLDDELRMESALAQLLGERPGWNPCLLSTELQYAVMHDNEYA